MVDGFEPLIDEGTGPSVSPSKAKTTLAVARNNYFIVPGGELSESGIIEHQAQSVSALAGYNQLASNANSAVAPVGIIGEVKHFECLRRPHVGERVETTVQMGMTFGNVTLAKCESTVDGETIAWINLKVFMQ